MNRARAIGAVVLLLVVIAVPVGVVMAKPLVDAAKDGARVRDHWAAAVANPPPQWRADADAVNADAALWAVLMPKKTADAAAYLAPRLHWTGAADAKEILPAIPDNVIAALDDFTHADEVPLDGVDTSWMRALPGFTHWDLSGSGPGAASPDEPGPLAPRPTLIPLFHWGKLRLVEGIAHGGFDDAERDVRALARLLWSSDTLLGGAMAAALLTADDDARHVVADLGVPLAEPPLVSARRLEKLVLTSSALYAVLTPPSFAPYEKTDVRFCGALAEGAAGYMLGRSTFATTDHAREVAIDAALRASPCSLTRVRRQWAAGTGELVDVPGRGLPRMLTKLWLRDALIGAGLMFTPAGYLAGDR